MKLILIVLAVIVLVGGGVVGGILFAGGGEEEGSQTAETDELHEEAQSGGHTAKEAPSDEKESGGGGHGGGDAKSGGHGGGHGGGEGEEEAVPELYIDLSPIVTNLAGPRTTSRVQAAIWLESYDEEAKRYIEQHQRVIQDSIITIFNGKTKDDLNSAEGKQMLKRQILMALENTIGKDKVKSVGYSSLMLQ